jgi:hypothetical protein
VIVLDLFTLLFADLIFHSSFQAAGATADKGAAELNPVHGSDHQATRPGGGKDLIALQLAGDVTAQGKHSIGVLAFQGIADGILTDTANAAAQRALAAFGLDAMQRAELARTSQEDGLEDFLQGVITVASTVRQRGKPGKEIKHLIEIPLELVSTQVLAVTLSPAPGSAACDATGDED